MDPKKTSLIITEKAGVARKTACAVCSKKPCEERNCPHYRIDIFVHHFGKVDKYIHPISLFRCRSKELGPNGLPVYFREPHCRNKTVSLVFSSRKDGSRDANILRSIREILRDWREPGLRKPIMEQVDWYHIPNGFGGQAWMVLHTNGNPNRLDIRRRRKQSTNKFAPEPTFPSTDPKQIRERMFHSAKHSRGGSARMRLRFVEHLFKEAGQFQKIIVATDIDVAGTYIAATLPKFTGLVGSDKVRRAEFQDTTTEGIRSAIRNAMDFDWHNAEAGRLRDTIDYVIGTGFYDVMSDITRRVKLKTSFTVGRTRLLALDCICRRWLQARSWKETGDVYLVFLGLGDRESIAEQLRQEAFLALGLKTSRGPFSPAGLLRELMIKEVGTVSTRYKLVKKLSAQGLIQQHAQWLVPTPKGVLVHEQLGSYLEKNGFSLWEWNHRINAFIANAVKNRGRPLTKLSEETDAVLYEFLSCFLPVLYKSVPILSLLLKQIYLAKGQKASGKKDSHSFKARHEGSDADKVLFQDAISLAEIECYVDVENNIIREDEGAFVKRNVPQFEHDWEGMMRRLIHMEREVCFQLVKGINISRLPYMSEGMCSVFRARCEPAQLEVAVNAVRKSRGDISNQTPLRVEEPIKDDSLIGAHEPLGLFDITPGDIPGPKGFQVAEEYMRPYRYTLDLFKASRAKIPLLERFSCGSLEFYRVHPFTYGTVHTFDTLLSAMYDRYQMEFDETAEIAESLYLGGGG